MVSNTDNVTLEMVEKNIGEAVIYVPYHTKGDRNHPDCREGVITSVNKKFIFVRFLGPGAEVCKPDQLQFK